MSRRFKLGVTLLLLSGALSAAILGASDPSTEGHITLARLRWGSDLRGYGRGFSAAWNHDYPRAEQHLSMIIKDITFADIRTDADRRRYAERQRQVELAEARGQPRHIGG